MVIMDQVAFEAYRKQMKKLMSHYYQEPAQLGPCLRLVIHLLPDGHLLSGDAIHGHVELCLSQSSFIGEISVNLGLQIIHKEDADYTENHPDTKRTRMEVISQRLLLPSGVYCNERFEPGYYIREFILAIPANLPSTFFGTNGRIKSLFYLCETKLLLHGLDDHGGRLLKEVTDFQPIIIQHQASRDLLLANHMQVSAHGVVAVKNVFDMSGSVDAMVGINKPDFLPGENLVFSVEIGNCYRKLAVFACLRETLEPIIEVGSHHETKIVDHIRLKIGKLKPKEHFRRWCCCSVWIPDPMLLGTHEGSLQQLLTTEKVSSIANIRSRWSFVVTVQFLAGKPLHVEIPITII